MLARRVHTRTTPMTASTARQKTRVRDPLRPMICTAGMMAPGGRRADSAPPGERPPGRPLDWSEDVKPVAADRTAAGPGGEARSLHRHGAREPAAAPRGAPGCLPPDLP